MEKVSHIGDNDLVDIGQQFVCWMISKLAGAKGIEAADTSEESTFFGEFSINECADGSQSDKPCPLDVVHQ